MNHHGLNRTPRMAHRLLALALIGSCLGSLGLRLPAAETASAQKRNKAMVLMVKGAVQVSWAGTEEWLPARTNIVLTMGDRLRTGVGAQAAIRLSDSSLIRLSETTTIEVQALPAAAEKPGFDLKGGLLHFFSRERPEKELRWRTPVASGAIRGTEFTVRVGDDGATDVIVLEGEVELSNEAGAAVAKAGERLGAAAGQAPVMRPALDTLAAIQWCLYYPGLLDLSELDIDSGTAQALAASLAAWARGDLLQAAAQYPPDRQATTPAERVYAAALALSVGQVAKAEQTLARLEGPLAGALQQLIATVQFRPWTRPLPPVLATEWLAESYQRQAAFDLKGALQAAREATAQSPEFGFAWARLAELEFSFGRVGPAERALEKALEFSPANAQAWTLRGFIALARERTVEAEGAFARAMALDGSLANAWLGRGLCRFRQRRLEEGLADLQAAALLEPNRSLLRSYLGKGYQHSASYGRNFGRRTELLDRADRELDMARRLDALDPTPWLYQALLDHQRYASAEAIADLLRSEALNNQRGLYRSRLSLDQDQAVRLANQARIYEDVGMPEVSRRASARAVMQDYANYSAHLNLASSFDALRDPSRFNLRHESEWFNEHLLSVLLAPVDGSSLSQNLSQQEYSRAFVADRFGGASTTDYQSSGEFHQLASQFGVFGRTGYAVDLDFLDRNGVRPNNDLSRLDLALRVKEQLGSRDSVLLMAGYQDYESGDQFQYYDPALARPHYRLWESQEPVLIGGYHHEWSPGVHTLILAGRLTDEQTVTDPAAPRRLVLPRNASPLASVGMDLDYENQVELYLAELNQIHQGDQHTDVLGVRLVGGEFDAWSRLSNPPAGLAGLWPAPLVSQGGGDMERMSAYGYHTWAIRPNLLLTAGLTYDRLTTPVNYRRAPVTEGEERSDHWSPKAALVWTPRPPITFRFAYAQAVGGVSYDEGVRLEPTQLAGFSQSHRSLLSESVAGSVEAPRYDLWGAGLDVNLGSETFITVEGRLMRESVNRWTGAVYLDQFSGQTWLAPFAEDLHYREESVSLTVNRILVERWFLEGGYQFARSTLELRQALVPDQPAKDRSVEEQSNLHVLRAGLAYRPRSGWFGQARVAWYIQDNQSTVTDRPGDDVPMVDLWLGWQFPLRRGEVAVGLLNLADQDYRLYPLNYYWEMPRERTFAARLKWNF